MYPACLSDVSEDGNYFLRLTLAAQQHPATDIKQITAFVAIESEIKFPVSRNFKIENHLNTKMTRKIDNFFRDLLRR